MATRMLRLPQLQERLPISRTKIYELMSEGRFPTPVSIGDRAVYWLEDEVEEWLRSRIEEQKPRMLSQASRAPAQRDSVECGSTANDAGACASRVSLGS